MPANDRQTHHPSSGRMSSPRPTAPDDNTKSKPRGQTSPGNSRNHSWETQNGSSPSPPPSRSRSRAPSETATTQFPLNDIDYESSPAAVAQELSNLQALRRMSMDVAATGDPDLPSLSAAGMPAAPSASDSEDDSSRLFWVPARLHPELAPKEFKSFLESKADQIKRRSGELSTSTSPDSSSTSSLHPDGGSGKGLNRKKSMLSRQINNDNGRGADGYRDGADRLEHKRSESTKGEPHDPNLEELESLVTDVAQLGRLSLERAENPGQDIILPSMPGQSLRRSTRTQYRRGSTKGQSSRSLNSRRTGRTSAADSHDSHETLTAPTTPSDPHPPAPQGSNASSELFEPFSAPAGTTVFSRPTDQKPPPPERQQTSSLTADREFTVDAPADRPPTLSQPRTRPWHSKLSSHGRSSLQIPPENQSVPQVVVDNPPEKGRDNVSSRGPSPAAITEPTGIQNMVPERTSSREDSNNYSPPPTRGSLRSSSPLNHQNNNRLATLGSSSTRSLEHMSSNPSPLPGNHTNTGDLSFIPTLSEEKKKSEDRKGKDGRKEDTRKSSWGWLLDNKDKRLDTSHHKSKAKSGKSGEKHDGTRLDVLAHSIEGGKGRDSVVLDRSHVKLEEERKKESARKQPGPDGKKEKDGLFSSIFGGGKKHKSDRDGSGRKHHARGLIPEPPHKLLKPDVDYNWTRFSILEERAIYRMAHIKLANPRRALYSQVLLSNFMYSYLAKVQQMHPHMTLQANANSSKASQQPSKEPNDDFTQFQQYHQVSSLYPCTLGSYMKRAAC